MFWVVWPQKGRSSWTLSTQSRDLQMQKERESKAGTSHFNEKFSVLQDTTAVLETWQNDDQMRKIGMRTGFDLISPVEFCPFSRFVLPYYPCYSSFLILLHGVRSDGLRLAEEPAYFQRSRLSKPCYRAIRKYLRNSLEFFGYTHFGNESIDTTYNRAIFRNELMI